MFDIHRLDADVLKQHVIVRTSFESDNECYGHVAVLVDGRVALNRYGHCSCETTWTGMRNDSFMRGGAFESGRRESVPVTGDSRRFIGWMWTGTVDQFLFVARHRLDPVFAGSFIRRPLSPDDVDYLQTVVFLDAAVKWGENGGKHPVRVRGSVHMVDWWRNRVYAKEVREWMDHKSLDHIRYGVYDGDWDKWLSQRQQRLQADWRLMSFSDQALCTLYLMDAGGGKSGYTDLEVDGG